MTDKPIYIGVNAPYDLGRFNDSLSTDYKRQLMKIYDLKKGQNRLTLNDLRDKDKYDVISINSKRTSPNLDNKISDSDDKLIYEIIPIKKKDLGKDISTDQYEIHTGIFVGCLVINGQKLIINTGYDKDDNDSFFRLLIKQANNIYVNSKANNKSDNNFCVFNILEFLFLSTLKKAIALSLPKKYETKTSKNWNVKGKIDFKKYFSSDFYKKDGITYTYRELSYDTDILNVLIYALSLCNKDYIKSNFNEITAFANEIKSSINIVKPNELMLKKCLNSPNLFNGLYSGYRKALVYAEMIIKHANLNPSNENGKKAVGWIVDVSELWEEYLYNLLTKNFPDWQVSAQEKLDLYNGTFYARSNYPDIIMRDKNDGHIIILDAKFKKMDFKPGDVDRSDLHQMQSYYGYYSSLGEKVDVVSLVYPSRGKPSNEETTFTNMFGHTNCPTRFGISYIKVGDNNIDETEFIDRLRKEIETGKNNFDRLRKEIEAGKNNFDRLRKEIEAGKNNFDN